MAIISEERQKELAEQVGKGAYKLYQTLRGKNDVESDQPSIDELLKGKGQSGRVRIYQAIKPDGTALWPEYRPIEWLAREKATMVDANFNAQYQNDPSGLSGVLLDIGWLNYYHEDHIPDLENFMGAQGADPAYSEGESANHFGHCTSAKDPKTGKIYVLGFAYDKLPAPQHEDFLRLQYIHWAMQNLTVSRINYETVGPSQGTTDFLMESNQAHPTLPIPLYAEPPKGTKEQRILSLKPHLGNGTILFPGHKNLDGEWELKKDRGFNEFKKQFTSYPVGGRDDLLDGLFLSVDPLLVSTIAAAVMRVAPAAKKIKALIEGRAQPNFEDDEDPAERVMTPGRRHRQVLQTGRLGSVFAPRRPMSPIANFRPQRPAAVQRMEYCSCTQDNRCFRGCKCIRACVCGFECGCKQPRYLEETV